MRLIEQVRQAGRLLYAPLIGYPGVQLTRSSVVDNLTRSSVQTATLMALIERIDVDVVFPFMDLSVEAEALGLAVRFHDNGSPDVIEHPITSAEELEHYSIPNPAIDGRMHVFTDTINQLKNRSTVMVSGYVSSPFTLAGLLMGAENLAINTLIEPDFCKSCIEFATGCIIPYAKAQQHAGADMIVLLDPTAVLLSPNLYGEFVQPYVERVADALDIPVVLHVCGQTTPIMEKLADTRVDGLSLDSDVVLPEIMHLIDDEMVIIGNVNPVATMLQKDAAGVYEETEVLIHAMEKYENFIVSTGCDVPLEAPLENLAAFTAARE